MSLELSSYSFYIRLTLVIEKKQSMLEVLAVCDKKYEDILPGIKIC